MLPVVLVHGGLYEETNPQTFWMDTGVAPALAKAGMDVFAPARPKRPTSWSDEADALAASIEKEGLGPAAVVAGSNGCSVALRLALDHPQLVERLMLCWPATAGDPILDPIATVIISDEADAFAADSLLSGDTVRGCSDRELRGLSLPCVIYPSMPENKIHQRKTAMTLLEVIPDAMLLGGSPEPISDEFEPFLNGFVNLVHELARVEDDD